MTDPKAAAQAAQARIAASINRSAGQHHRAIAQRFAAARARLGVV